MRFNRKDIYWFDNFSSRHGAEIKKSRPAIIVSANTMNHTSDLLQIVCLTTQPKKDLPTHVVLTSGGEAAGSTAICEQIMSISKERLQNYGGYVGTISDEDMDAVENAILHNLGIELEEDDSEFEPDCEFEADSPAEESTSNMVVAQLEMERDFYKKQYEAMLERLIAGGQK